MTHLENQRISIMLTQNLICALIKWTPARYSEFMFEMGLKYLDRLFHDEKLCSMLATRKEFWNWWKNLWYQREEVFLGSDWEGCGINVKRDCYFYLHEPEVLVCEIAPTRVALGEEFITETYLCHVGEDK